MKLDIILQLLYTNGLQDVIARAVQIENNILMPYVPGDIIVVDLHKDDLPEGKKFRGNSGPSYGQLTLNIQAVNPYNLSTPYMVIAPNGNAKWVKPSERVSLSEIISTETSTVIAD